MFISILQIIAGASFLALGILNAMSLGSVGKPFFAGPFQYTVQGSHIAVSFSSKNDYERYLRGETNVSFQNVPGQTAKSIEKVSEDITKGYRNDQGFCINNTDTSAQPIIK